MKLKTTSKFAFYSEIIKIKEIIELPVLAQRSAEPSVAKLVNQFNFCEHASQTYNNALKVLGYFLLLII